MPSLGLRKHALKSSSLLGLRAPASNSAAEALEKAYNDPSAPHSRERIYQIAQARTMEITVLLVILRGISLILQRYIRLNAPK